MIKFTHAPNGYICQYVNDTQCHGCEGFLKITGEWKPTLDEAIASVKKQRPREIKKIQGQIARLEKKIEDLKLLMKQMSSASDDVVDFFQK